MLGKFVEGTQKQRFNEGSATRNFGKDERELLQRESEEAEKGFYKLKGHVRFYFLVYRFVEFGITTLSRELFLPVRIRCSAV